MRMFLLLFLLEMLQKYKLLPRVIILTLLLKLAKPLSRFSSCCISPLQIPIYWAKPSIPYSPMKEHPQYSEILPFSCVRAYTLRRDSKGAMPLGTRTLEQSLVCYTLPEVYRLPVRTYAAIALNAPYRWRSSSHKANLIPQSKRQDTTIIVIPCLCSFTVPSSPSAEPPINKKRTRTLSRKESGSSTNCMVEN